MTDADVDGAHITTLLLTFAPLADEEGHVFLAQPPLLPGRKRKETGYAYSDSDLEQTINAIGRDGTYKIQRAPRGWGEMDAWTALGNHHGPLQAHAPARNHK